MDPIVLIFLAVAGLAGGFVGAQVGGGALITLPALLYLGLTPSGAVGTNVLSALAINVVALFTYNHIKKLKVKENMPLAVAALVGSVIGANLVLNVDKAMLSKTMAVLLAVAAFFVLVKPHRAVTSNKKSIQSSIAIPVAFIIGIYGGFLSASVTTVLVLLMMLLGKNELRAIEDSVFVTAVLLLGALGVFYFKGSIDYDLAWPLAGGSAVGAFIGAKTALKMGERWLRILLVVALVLAAIKLLF